MSQLSQEDLESIRKGTPPLVRERFDAFIARERTLTMQYLGVLQLSANMALHLGEDDESTDLRSSLEDALDDAKKVVTRLRWRRILNRFDIDLIDPEDVDG